MKKLAFIAPTLVALLCLWFALHERGRAREAIQAHDETLRQRDALRAEVASLENAAQMRVASHLPPTGAGEFTTANGTQVRTRIRPFSAAVASGRLAGPMGEFDSPEMRSLMAIEQMGRLDGRYASLFQALRLPRDQLDRLKQLLVEKQNVPMDVLAAAKKQELLGPGTGANIQQLMQQEMQTVDASIRSLLGETAYEEYQDYEKTRAERSLVEQLASRLSYSDSPLTAPQREALVDVLAAAESTQPNTPQPVHEASFTVVSAGIDSTVSFAGGGGESPVITDESIAGAEGVLDASQLAALRDLQATQQAQKKMSELIRQSLPRPTEGGWLTLPVPDPVGAPVVP